MANQHFFQPLLPGFHSHLTIPVAFMKNIEGRYEQKTAELRSDVSNIIWEVKIDGRKLTDGWKEFALSHNLQIGDIIIFRQEEDMSFHVTPFAPSFCEIQYESCLDEESNSEKIQEESKKGSSSLDPSCFVANVSLASLQYDLLYLPKRFVRANGIDIGCGEIELMNEKGKRSWTLSLRQKQSCGSTYIRNGWRSFCGVNGLNAGDSVTFRLSQRGETFVLTSFSSKELEEANEVMSLSTEPECDEEDNIGKIQMKENPRREIESSSLDLSCFVANVTPGSLRYDRLNLPRSFVRENGLDRRSGEIVLVNEKGRSWTSELKGKDSDPVTYIHGGWRSFCGANGVKAGGIVTFKLIQRRGTLSLRFLSTKEPEEEEANEVVSLSTESESEEEINIGKIQRKKKPRRERETKSSSSLETSCFVAHVAPYSLRDDILYLPTKFVMDTRSGLIYLMNEKGKSWPLKLRKKRSCETIYIRRGWRSFCNANGLEAGTFFTLKLIRKGRTQVLRLYHNVPEEEEGEETNEVESLSTEPESDGESSQEERKPSSSSSQDRFVTLAIRPYNINRYVLRLPLHFTDKNGINEETKMTMLDKHGVKWPVTLRPEIDRRIRVGGSWKDFLKANCVKTNESIRLELVWEKDSRCVCVLKFRSKVKL